MHPGLLIQRMILCLDRACRECSPSSAHVSAGTSRTSMRDLNSVTILGNETICLLENVREVSRAMVFVKFNVSQKSV